MESDYQRIFVDSRDFGVLINDFVKSFSSAQVALGLLRPFLKIVDSLYDEKESVVDDFLLKVGFVMECPILACPVYSLSNKTMVYEGRKIPILNEFGMLFCCWVPLSMGAYINVIEDPSGLCPFCRKISIPGHMEVEPNSFFFGAGVRSMMTMFILAAKQEPELEINLFTNKLIGLRESLEEFVMREFTDDLILMMRDSVADKESVFRFGLMKEEMNDLYGIVYKVFGMKFLNNFILANRGL